MMMKEFGSDAAVPPGLGCPVQYRAALPPNAGRAEMIFFFGDHRTSDGGAGDAGDGASLDVHSPLQKNPAGLAV
jgi:hypothetical protein